MQQQKYPEALDALTEAIHIIEWKKEPSDCDYVLTLTNLGEVYRKMKRYDNALATMERALVVTESLFGHDNIKIALPVTDLALLNIEVGRFKEAQSVVARGLSILRSQRTKKPLFIYLTQLSEKYVEMNKCADASPYIQAAKRIHEENPEESDVGFNIKLQSLLNKCVKDKSKSTRNSQYSSRLNDAEYDAVQSMDSALSCHGGKIQRIGRSDGGEEILMCVQ